MREAGRVRKNEVCRSVAGIVGRNEDSSLIFRCKGFTFGTAVVMTTAGDPGNIYVAEQTPQGTRAGSADVWFD